MTTDPHKIKLLNQCRVTRGAPEQWLSTDADGMNGMFVLPFTAERGSVHRLGCIASNQGGWEHVSVTDQTSRKSSGLAPSWEMMCRVKRAFWDDEETVVEYHVPMVEWINDHPGCLHLWRPISLELPRPPALFVGVPD